MSTHAINWLENYRAVFGDISDKRAQSWETYIDSNVRNIEAKEVDEAVAWLCDNYQEERGSKPTCKDIVRVIYSRRPASRRPIGADPLAALKNEIRAWVAEAKNNAVAWNQVWDRICTPNNAEHCNELERFAGMTAGHLDAYGNYKFNRSVVPDIGTMIADWKGFDPLTIFKTECPSERPTVAKVLARVWTDGKIGMPSDI